MPKSFRVAKESEIPAGSAKEVEFDGRVYVPTDRSQAILSAMTLPDGCGNFESTHSLFATVFETFTRYGFPDEVALPTTHFIFSTWFADCLPFAPHLRISGPIAFAQ